VIRYAEHHKKDPSEVAWSVVEADGGTAKWSGTTPAPKPKMMFAVLKKREKASKEQRRVNEFAIMQQRGGDSGRMSYREAMGLMHDQGGMMVHDGGQMQVQGAGAEADGAGAEAEAPEYRRCRCAGGCDDEAMPGEDVCARCYTIEGCCDLDSPDERDSESHTESSPQLGDREGMCEHHSGHGSHGC
jgi:hypothetical protein